MHNGWADDSLSPSLFAYVHEEVEHEGSLCEAKETPGSHFERSLNNAPKNIHGD